MKIDEGSFEKYEDFCKFVDSRQYLTSSEKDLVKKHEREHALVATEKGYNLEYRLTYSPLFSIGRLQMFPHVTASVVLRTGQKICLEDLSKITSAPKKKSVSDWLAIKIKIPLLKMLGVNYI